MLTAPWKIRNELFRWLTLPAARLAFALAGVAWQDGWRIYDLPVLQRTRGSTLTIGTHLQMRNWLSSNPLAPNHPTVLATRSATAELVIGNHVGMTGATIVAEHAVHIGHHVRVGANATIVDTDFHPLTAAERHVTPTAGSTRPVIIEDDVFIGMAAIILKGSHIGRGSVVGAGSVVSGSVPPGVIVAGNPAVVIRELRDE